MEVRYARLQEERLLGLQGEVQVGVGAREKVAGEEHDSERRAKDGREQVQSG